jgi:hypothetical protein
MLSGLGYSSEAPVPLVVALDNRGLAGPLSASSPLAFLDDVAGCAIN